MELTEKNLRRLSISSTASASASYMGVMTTQGPTQSLWVSRTTSLLSDSSMAAVTSSGELRALMYSLVPVLRAMLWSEGGEQEEQNLPLAFPAAALEPVPWARLASLSRGGGRSR